MPVLYANHSWSDRALTEVHVREFWLSRESCDYVAKKPDVVGASCFYGRPLADLGLVEIIHSRGYIL